MSRRQLLSPLAVVAALVLAAPVAGAQERATDSVTVTTSEVAPAPVTTAPAMLPAPVAATRPALATDVSASAFRAARAQEAGVAVAQAGGSRGEGKLYMIVGGAAFLAGAIIGDDAGTIIMIGGAGVGIYGLYLYLR